MTKTPVTAAVRELRKHAVAFTDHPYDYQEKGGTEVSSRALGVDEHAVIKTLVMETETGAPLVVLMHGDRQVSTKELARLVGSKTISPCKPDTANRHSGYLVGGTSPFGLRKPMPIYLQTTVAHLPKIYLNGGKRGYLIALAPQDLIRVLQPTLVDVAITG